MKGILLIVVDYTTVLFPVATQSGCRTVMKVMKVTFCTADSFYTATYGSCGIMPEWTQLWITQFLWSLLPKAAVDNWYLSNSSRTVMKKISAEFTAVPTPLLFIETVDLRWRDDSCGLHHCFLIAFHGVACILSAFDLTGLKCSRTRWWESNLCEDADDKLMTLLTKHTWLSSVMMHSHGPGFTQALRAVSGQPEGSCNMTSCLFHAFMVEEHCNICNAHDLSVGVSV